MTALILETFRLNGELISAGNKLTKPMNMTSARWQVMGAIDEHGQPLTVAQISRRMGLARQGVQRIVNDLESQELVDLIENVDHKRSPLVTISKSGASTMAEINELQSAWVNELSNDLSEQSIRSAIKLLETVRIRTEKTNQQGEH